ncbi:MAG: hypothetical protein LC657_08640 [Desulfobacteraceae bacterium]|nr:hypothetical protein [Desulfobacteraceae bacterium]
MLPEPNPGFYDLKLCTRILWTNRFKRWSFGLTMTIAGIIIAILKFTGRFLPMVNQGMPFFYPRNLRFRSTGKTRIQGAAAVW